LPVVAENLLHIIGIRNRLKPLQAQKMGYDGKYLYIFFRKNSPVEPARIIELYHKKIHNLRFTPDYKLYVPIAHNAENQILAQADSLLKMLAQ
jgi:transcription-repair coupling factor (superfamily II helicase)